MKFWQLLLGFSLAFYALVSWLLARPISSKEVLSQVSTDSVTLSKQAVILKMADYVEKTSEKSSAAIISQHFSSPIEVGGFELNPELKSQLASSEGIEAFKQRIGDRSLEISKEINNALNDKLYRNTAEREILLDLAHALIRLKSSSILIDRFAREAKLTLQSTEPEQRAYSGRALQYYLESEADPEKKAAMIKSFHSEL